jgi:hypothetical protein
LRVALTLQTFADKPPNWQLALLDANFAEIEAAINDGTLGTLYLVDQGSVNALSVQLPAGISLTLQAGVLLQVRAANTNTSATVTLNIQGIGQEAIVNPPAFALGIGQIQKGGIYGFQFDGTNWQLVSASGPAGVANPTFQSGPIQFNLAGTLFGAGNFQLGFALPNASGIPSQGILIGGAGASQVVHITDAQVPGQQGITVIREAGDAGDNTSGGGNLLDFAGGSVGGMGGTATYQGGTSVNGQAGNAVLAGGNTTNGTPGNAVCIGGQTGPVGAGVLLIMTKPPGASGFGTVAIHANSAALIEFLSNGEISLDASGTGPGLAGQALVSQGLGSPAKWLTAFTGSFTTNDGRTAHVSSGLITSVA